MRNKIILGIKQNAGREMEETIRFQKKEKEIPKMNGGPGGVIRKAAAGGGGEVGI